MAQRARSIVSKPEDEAVANSVLLSLSKEDREAIYQYYVERRKPVDIERDLGLRIGYVTELKASVRKKYDELHSKTL